MGSVNQNNLVYLSDLDDLYTRLYNLRNLHYNSAYQQNQANIPAFDQSSNLSVGSTIETSKIEKLKTELSDLKNSKWYLSGTVDNNTLVSMTDFGISLNTPSVGDLITASDFNLLESAVTEAEKIVPAYSSQYNGNYTFCYGTNYSFCYGSDYGFCYGSDYGSDYSGRYSGCYSGRYSGQYSGRYGGKYTFCYGFCYSGRSRYF